jgi:hypothetical protein
MPDVDDLVVALAGGDHAGVALGLDLEHLLVGGVQVVLFLGRDDHVVHADRDAGARRGEEAQVLELVEHVDRHLLAEVQVHVADEVGQALLLQVPVDEGNDVLQRPVEEHAADRRVDQLPFHVLHLGVENVLVVVLGRQVDVFAGVADPDRRVGRDVSLLVGSMTSSKSAKMRPSPFEFERDLVR